MLRCRTAYVPAKFDDLVPGTFLSKAVTTYAARYRGIDCEEGSAARWRDIAQHPDTALARIFHKDVLQAQQLGSWQGSVDFDPAGNAVGIPFTGPERDL